MPSKSRGQPGTEFAKTSKPLREEITINIINRLTVEGIWRKADSILMSPNTHLDSRPEGAAFKVDIQYKRIGGPYSGQTIATVMVLNDEASDEELKEAFRKCLKDGNVWEVS